MRPNFPRAPLWVALGLALVSIACLPPAPTDRRESFDPGEEENLVPPAYRARPDEEMPVQAAPSGDHYVVKERAAEETPGEHDALVDDAFVHFKSENYAKLGKLRRKLQPVHVREFIDVHWHPKMPWDVKNGFVHLLADRDETGVSKVMGEGLNSPTEHIRSTAQAALTRLEESAPLAESEPPPPPPPPPLLAPGVLVPSWNPRLPWELKNVFVRLLAQTPEDGIEEVMLDALAAPSPETRATAILYLAGSTYSRPALMVAGELSESKLAAAAEAIRAGAKD